MSMVLTSPNRQMHGHANKTGCLLKKTGMSWFIERSHFYYSRTMYEHLYHFVITEGQMSSTHTITLTHMAVIPECLHTTHPADMVEISQLLCKAETRMLSLMSKSYMADRLDSYRCFVNVGRKSTAFGPKISPRP
ncbi:hypothetical protein ILYODFUR_023592 [Ilyodon furcidens]|uniref:Uncharacterized protein n=1 Tax=Ilyodon furcidens TaxID=33524 RepID=A0ABV0TLB1_9TELE